MRLLLSTFYANSQGSLKYVNGDEYIGDWKDHKHHGHGTCTRANGSYVGEWKDDKLRSQGTFTLANGDVYVGEWQEN